MYFAIEDRCIDVGVEVVGDGVFQDNEVIREIPPMIGHQPENLVELHGDIYPFLDSPFFEVIRVTELANLPISNFRPRLTLEVFDEASLVVFGNKILHLGKTPRGGITLGGRQHRIKSGKGVRVGGVLGGRLAKWRSIIVGVRVLHFRFPKADLVVDASKNLRIIRGVLRGFKSCPPRGKVKGGGLLQKKALFFFDTSHLLPRTKLGANGDDRGKHTISFIYLGV